VVNKNVKNKQPAIFRKKSGKVKKRKKARKNYFVFCLI
jgi:hypothetical protein